MRKVITESTKEIIKWNLPIKVGVSRALAAAIGLTIERQNPLNDFFCPGTLTHWAPLTIIRVSGSGRGSGVFWTLADVDPVIIIFHGGGQIHQNRAFTVSSVAPSGRQCVSVSSCARK